MEALAEYTIAFTGLRDGQHQFDWELDQAFFDATHEEEFQGGNIHVKLTLDKSALLLVANLHVAGTVSTTCDHCAAPLDLPVEGNQRQIFQLHGDPDQDDEELVVLDQKASSINLTHYIYECLRLALPARHVHAPGQCDPEVESALGNLSVEHEPIPDPRWDALNQLKQQRP